MCALLRFPLPLLPCVLTTIDEKVRNTLKVNLALHVEAPKAIVTIFEPLKTISLYFGPFKKTSYRQK